MKASVYPLIDPERFNCLQQIAAHVGGMRLALARHHPIHWTFHWRGICRAISSEFLLASRVVKRSLVKSR